MAGVLSATVCDVNLGGNTQGHERAVWTDFGEELHKFSDTSTLVEGEGAEILGRSKQRGLRGGVWSDGQEGERVDLHDAVWSIEQGEREARRLVVSRPE